MTYTERMAAAAAWERTVVDRLHHEGWQVEPYGQALLTPAAKQMLQQHTMAQHRWLPDLIAGRDDSTILVDCKATLGHQPCHAIEKSSLSSLVAHEQNALLPVYVVFNDWHVARACELWELTDDSRVCRTGPPSARGSGTPYWLFNKTKMPHMFDDVFTRRPQISLFATETIEA